LERPKYPQRSINYTSGDFAFSALLTKFSLDLAATTVAADAFSTGVFVMNPLTGTRFIDALPRSERLVITGDGKEFKSKG